MRRRHFTSVPRSAPSDAVDRSKLRPRVFVGRDRELAELIAGLDNAIVGNGSLILLAGEPGIGKTRLLEEVASRADAEGVRVLWGRCWEGSGAPEYWPWIQVLRAQLQRPDAPEGPTGWDVARLRPIVPELSEGAPPVAETLDPEQARFALLDAAVRFLCGISRAQPLVVLLDDLHSADMPSLLLLRLLAGQLQQNPILVVGTYRPTDAKRRESVSELLGELLRWGKLLPLVGLEEVEICALIEGVTGTKPPASVTGAVHRTTDGNPFYVDELMRLLQAEGRLIEEPPRDPLGVPEGVRAAIRRRVASLGRGMERLLGCAAVAGRDFDLAVVAQAAGVSREAALEMVGDAVSAEVVRESDSAAESFSFVHALFQETLYDNLPPSRRRRLHRAVGAAMEAVHGADRVVTELAYHFYEAVPELKAAEALPYLRRAARRAMALLAYEDAAIHGRRALDLAARLDPDDALLCTLLLELGTAEAHAGDHEDARRRFLSAAQIARRLGSVEQFARAALGYGTGLGAQAASAYRANETLIDLLEEAVDRLGDIDSALRVRALSRLAVELYTTDRDDEREALSRQAMDVARSLGDSRVLAEAMLAHYEATLGPDSLEERLSACPEIIRLAREVGDKQLSFEAHHLRLHTVQEASEIDLAQEDLAVCERLADELRMPLFRWKVLIPRAMRAFARGDLSEATRLTDEGYALRGHVSSLAATSAYWGMQVWIRWMSGEIQDVEGPAEDLGERAPRGSFWRAAHPFVLYASGAEPGARIALQRAASEGFVEVPRRAAWGATLHLAALCAAGLEETSTAAFLYELLLPEADRIVVSMRGMFGPVAASLGVLATTLGRLEDAEDHFELALERARTIGSRPYTAFTLREYAAMLLVRDRPGDAERARKHVEEALRLIDQHGLEGLRTRALELRSAATGPESGSRLSEPVFRLEGEYWTIALRDEVVRIRDSKGLRYLAELLRCPGRHIHVLDLVAATGGVGAERLRRAEAAEAGLRVTETSTEDLDAAARAAYRRRIEDLEAEIAGAEEMGDVERIGSLRAEQDFLARELASALGLGRKKPSRDAERARVAVTNAVRRTVRRIEKEAPALGRHLDGALITGRFCSYSPHTPVAWRL